MASDFAIAQFRFLERLLVVHGHWCYKRIAQMVIILAELIIFSLMLSKYTLVIQIFISLHVPNMFIITWVSFSFVLPSIFILFSLLSTTLYIQICYFFYKNIAFGLTIFYFEAFAAFSGQSVYVDWYMLLFNVVLTSLPVISLGVFEQDVDSEVCLQVIFLSILSRFHFLEFPSNHHSFSMWECWG